MSSQFRHPKLGIVRYTFRGNARHYIFRWKGDVLHFTIPSYATARQAMEAIDSMADELLAKKPVPKQLYHTGQRLDFDLFSVRIVSDLGCADSCVATFSGGEPVILVGDGVDINAVSTQKTISRLIIHFARYYAKQRFPERLAKIAGTLGVGYDTLQITTGRKILGRCSSAGKICLTACLAVYPTQIIDYVICHELSHVSEMNHSSRFHRLCDSYCLTILGKSEKEMESVLKAFTPMLL